MNQKGFSLMELMIVIFIIGVASSIVVTQYSGNRNFKALYLGSKQIANDIRMTQNYTFSALETGGANPSGGYGIRFSKNSNSYVIFADKDSNKMRNAVGSEDFQTINLPEDTEVISLKIGAISYNDIDVVFTSPYGEVYIDGINRDAGNFINLEIGIGNSAGTKVININSSRGIN
jgi:prepilin-type N-terminal cleavage/methylation domain-containing protein